MSRVVVLGAGLAGLSATLALRQAGASCRTLEREPEPGGHARTTWEDGFGFDRTGHLLHLRDPELRELALSALAESGADVLELERRSRVWSHGRMTRYPFQANTFGLPPEVAFACVSGFLRARETAWEAEPRDFEEFSLQRFGAGFSEHFMLPYNERLWGVPAREITAAWCQRFVPVPSVEDVVAGAVGMNDRELGYNARFHYPRLGIGELSRALARRAGPVELGRAPRSVDLTRRELVLEGDGEVVPWDTLVSTIPLDRLLALVADLPPEVRQAAGRLRCQRLLWLDLAMDEPARHDLHWVYVPEAHYPFYRVGCYSNFSRSLAPEGSSSYYVELASRDAPDLGELVPSVLRDLRELGLVHRPEALRFARLRSLEHAYVLFDHAYEPALAVVRPFLEGRGVISTGRYGGWNYSSMEDALRMGQAAARGALAASRE